MRIPIHPGKLIRRMSLENELSSDIAVALLTAKDKDPHELTKLKELVLKIHSALRDMPRRSVKDRARTRTAGGSERD